VETQERVVAALVAAVVQRLRLLDLALETAAMAEILALVVEVVAVWIITALIFKVMEALAALGSLSSNTS